MSAAAERTRVAVLGAGSWGTTLAVHLATLGHEVALWDVDAAQIEAIARDRENRKFLAGIALPESIKVCAAKGLELGTLQRMSDVLRETLADPAPVVLVGPSHAEEVSLGLPTSIVAASADRERAERVQRLVASPRLRVYSNRDVAGCEYGAALKNVIAIAAGICDGLGYGDNTKGALLTRGLAEITRLGVALGGQRDTFYGLTGMGDLITTAISRHSRNRGLGERLGRGETVGQVLGAMVMVAEGVNTAKAASDLGRRHGVETPITDQVRAILLDGLEPRAALEALMSRELKSEEWKGGAERGTQG
ncbi:MAG: NAD(P)-dependent glycerol-3-phosphate dehydrogenase [Candidatus Eisenbacteria bacterium]|uniref:Glycerol-3-phosphate dehydrogenase [NAD(P)+] n=1 Tax=Eiseniibacteriota bacterium TaxID=2212470 RepID=A0A9D6L8X4_UNCEI|nr:NAD(P)-dependent glycerol-3-phosphate dehydrogenase [Candidatus Eisenbacteria bacterium]